uniref:Peptidase S1 domain-containing protein n=1 Tax=Acrobeloides nanus TaxID=290746 RepID=A0A914E1V6_9BILA
MINSKFINIFIIFLPLVSSQCGTRSEYGNHKIRNSIVGGCLASPGEFPWQGVLQSIYSNGTVNIYPIVLISQNYAIIYGNDFNDNNPKLLASFGSADRENMTQNFDVTPSLVTFTSNTTMNLLKLNSSITFGPYIQPICMPRNDTYFINKTAIVSGWGNLDQATSCNFNDTNSKKVSQQGDSSRYLIAVSVPTFFDYNGCMQNLEDEGLPTPTTKYGYYYDICAGSNQAGGTIKDKGSPLQMEDSYGRWFLVGLQEEAFVKNKSEVFDQRVYFRISRECSYFVTLSNGDFDCYDPNVVTSTMPQKSSTMMVTKISTLSSSIGTTPSTAISSTTSPSTSSSTTTSPFTIISSIIRSPTRVFSTTKPSTTISSTSNSVIIISSTINSSTTVSSIIKPSTTISFTTSQSTIFSTANPSTTITSSINSSNVSPTHNQSTIISTTNPSTAISSSSHNSSTISPTKIFPTFKPPTTISSITKSSTKERSSSKSHKLTTNWWILLILSFLS